MPNDNPLGLPDRDALTDLARRANAGDAGALADLKAYLDQHPQIWQAVGDLAAHVRQATIRRIAGGDQLAEQSMHLHVAQLQQELAGPTPSRVEKIAVDAIVNAWLDLHGVQIKYAADAGKELPEARFLVQLRNSAQRRYDSAMRTLVLVKEKLPTIERANREYLQKEGKLVPFPARPVATA